MLCPRVLADRGYFSPYVAWADALVSWADALESETAEAGEQSLERWRLLIDLLSSGVHAFWALAEAAATQREQAALSRSALAQERDRAEIIGLLDPQILIRRPDDLTLLTEQYGSLARRELLSSRARDDIAYLRREPATISALQADAILRRLPSGVLAWA
ncbi:MAG: hypothetical protein EOM22_03870 [Gammaproteobacteria bacterium]|nr:hypothetical protein [Gammaproteobacteria bacterium]